MERGQTTLVKGVRITTTLQESMHDILALLVTPASSGSNMESSDILSVRFVGRGSFR
jgi:hypothetical protein